jgi:hypothetical protein
LSQKGQSVIWHGSRVECVALARRIRRPQTRWRRGGDRRVVALLERAAAMAEALKRDGRRADGSDGLAWSLIPAPVRYILDQMVNLNPLPTLGLRLPPG